MTVRIQSEGNGLRTCASVLRHSSKFLQAVVGDSGFNLGGGAYLTPGRSAIRVVSRLWVTQPQLCRLDACPDGMTDLEGRQSLAHPKKTSQTAKHEVSHAPNVGHPFCARTMW